MRLNPKIHFRTGTSSDPIPLHEFDRIGPVEFIEFCSKAICVSRDPQHPLFERHPHNRMAAAFAFAINDFFISEHGTKGKAPVDRRIGNVGEAMFVLVATNGFHHFGRAASVNWPVRCVCGLHGLRRCQRLGRCTGGLTLSARQNIVRNRQFRDRTPLAFSLNSIRASPNVIRVVPSVKDLQEDPLRPTIIIRIGRGEFARPVVAEPQHF